MNDRIFLDFLTDRELEIYKRNEKSYSSVYEGVISIIENSNRLMKLKRSKSP